MYNDETQERIARLLAIKGERQAGTNADELATLRAQVAELAADYDTRAAALRDGYGANLAAYNRAARQQEQADVATRQFTRLLGDVRDATVVQAFNAAAADFWPTPQLPPAKLAELQQSALPGINELYSQPQFIQALVRGDMRDLHELARRAVVAHPDNEGYVQQLESAVELQQAANNPDLSSRERMDKDWEVAASMVGLQATKAGHPGGVKQACHSPEAIAVLNEQQHPRHVGADGIPGQNRRKPVDWDAAAEAGAEDLNRR